MNDELSQFNGSSESQGVQQRTNIEFENPTHPDQSPAYTSTEEAQAYFDVATAAKEWDSDRKVLIGEFLLGVEALAEDQSADRLAQFVGILTGEEVQVGDSTFDPEDQ